MAYRRVLVLVNRGLMFYAIGFGKWSLNKPGLCIDGQSAKVAGPFKTSKQAWKAAGQLQQGASLMCDDPFVFESGPIKLSTLAHKIDYNEYIVLEAYTGRYYVHRVRLIKPIEGFDPMELFFMNNGECSPYYLQPSSRLARCKLLNHCRKKYGHRKSWSLYEEDQLYIRSNH